MDANAWYFILHHYELNIYFCAWLGKRDPSSLHQFYLYGPSIDRQMVIASDLPRQSNRKHKWGSQVRRVPAELLFLHEWFSNKNSHLESRLLLYLFNCSSFVASSYIDPFSVLKMLKNFLIYERKIILERTYIVLFELIPFYFVLLCN